MKNKLSLRRRAIQAFLPEMVEIRHHIHAHPEIGFTEKSTAALVAEKLSSWGYQVTTGLAGTGVVGTLKAGSGQKSIGLRADMDALPIFERTGLAYESQSNGVMHACGHDGHTTMLLAAARYLAQTRHFSGTVNLFFQPAEEGLGGGQRMVSEGLFKNFPCDAVYGFHNIPGMPAGKLCFIPGVAAAASDRARIVIRGRSGHGAEPQNSVDPVVAGSAVVMALQSIVSRNINPLEAAVITVGSFLSGEAYNVIPETAELRLTIRSYNAQMRDFLENRIKDVAHHQAEAYGAVAEIDYMRINPATINDESKTLFAKQVAEQAFGKDGLFERNTPFTFSDDFAFMLEACPGAYCFIGNGDSAKLHNAAYDFNDAIILDGASYWSLLAEEFLAR